MSKNLSNRIVKQNAPQQAVSALLQRAKQHLANNEVDEAFTVLDEAETHYPNNPEVNYLIGKYTAEKKSHAEGIKKLEENIKDFPNHLNSLLELGNLYLKPGNTEKATPFYRKALEIAPENPGCYSGIGSLHQRKGDFPLAVSNYRKALELQLKHPINNLESGKKDDFEIEVAEKLLWDTLKLFCEHGLHVFNAFGSLLGLVRNGGLLLHDKDVDVGLPYSEIDRAVRVLQHHGWQEAYNSLGYISPRAMFHPKTKLSLDLFGFIVEENSDKTCCLGIVMPNTPKEWNILWDFGPIKLEKQTTPDGSGQIWALSDPEAWLEAIYGDWRTPDKNFDTLASAKNLRSFSLLVKCFTYSRILENWTKNNIPRSLSLTRAALHHEPNDALMKRVLTRLESRRK